MNDSSPQAREPSAPVGGHDTPQPEPTVKEEGDNAESYIPWIVHADGTIAKNANNNLYGGVVNDTNTNSTHQDANDNHMEMADNANIKADDTDNADDNNPHDNAIDNHMEMAEEANITADDANDNKPHDDANGNADVEMANNANLKADDADDADDNNPHDNAIDNHMKMAEEANITADDANDNKPHDDANGNAGIEMAHNANIKADDADDNNPHDNAIFNHMEMAKEANITADDANDNNTHANANANGNADVEMADDAGAGADADGGAADKAKDDPPAPAAKSETFTSLEAIRSIAAPGTIGEGVKLGLVVLDGLQGILEEEAKNGNEAARWLTRLASLKQKVKETRTVVGVLGNTGAGKSSLINALLDEESIIPTNCMRACTAVPTEISYNHDDNLKNRYHGEAEFITEEDWQKEVELLLSELVDPTRKLSKDYLQPDTGAGVAYAKIKAVYPHFSNDRLAKSNVRDLMDDPAVKEVLGTVRTHKRPTATALKADLQVYVDSAEKYGPGSQAHKALAYWPLVKLVRIYIKSKVLSTGTVLVDLPGVQDSNAARCAVAERFRAECSSIWVVSPINRAVDDKAAKNLMGTSFKLQLTMDGNYSNVTFICSKTDDISVEEVADKLDADGSIHAIWAKEEDCGRQMANFKREVRVLCEEKDELEDARDELEAQRSRKRKHREKPDEQSLEEESAQFAKELARIRKRLKELRPQMSTLQAECKKLNIEATARCVEARNNYSKESIRTDFADGVRETVEDAEAEQLDGAHPRPVIERDYAQIAKSLPVFCISNRGYQSLKGRSPKDGTINGYRCPADTEIPQLQEHAMRLGDVELIATNKTFLADFVRLMRSLLLWASNGRSGGGSDTEPLSEEEMSKMNCLETLIAVFRERLDTCIHAARAGMKTALRNELLGPIAPMCLIASCKLPGIAIGWAQNPNAVGTPIRWSTYRSICLHQGEGSTRLSRGMNFNEDLFMPLKKHMAVHWAEAFGKTFNNRIATYVTGAGRALAGFHNDFKSCAELDCSNTANSSLLNDQVTARTQAIQQTQEKFKVIVQTKQRVSSRWITKRIQAYMKDIYDQCASERGPGVFNRMKEALEDYVDQNRLEILTKPLEEVGVLLEELCSFLERHMFKNAEEIMVRIREDYQRAILGREMVLSGADTSPSLQAVQQKVHEMLLSVDEEFAEVLRAADAAS